jgi:hypothetical protein
MLTFLWYRIASRPNHRVLPEIEGTIAITLIGTDMYLICFAIVEIFFK